MCIRRISLREKGKDEGMDTSNFIKKVTTSKYEYA
jgi:hypothetical protein